MILFNLQCGGGHEFEAWFRNGDAYVKQEAKGVIACPDCGSTTVQKAPMAPRLSKGVAKRQDALAEFRRAVESRFENVGENFAEEARQIHYGEAEARPIYGQASADEVKELIDEEIPILPLPISIDHDA